MGTITKEEVAQYARWKEGGSEAASVLTWPSVNTPSVLREFRATISIRGDGFYGEIRRLGENAANTHYPSDDLDKVVDYICWWIAKQVNRDQHNQMSIGELTMRANTALNQFRTGESDECDSAAGADRPSD